MNLTPPGGAAYSVAHQLFFITQVATLGTIKFHDSFPIGARIPAIQGISKSHLRKSPP